MDGKQHDHHETPSWLDREFIEDALKSAEPETDASSVELVSVCEVQGGYLSQTFRAVTRSSSHCGSGGDGRRETSLIVKSASVVEGFVQDIMDSGVFTKEKTAYVSFLPAVDDALRSVEGENWQALGPKFYHEGSQPTSFLVLEDLSSIGFRKVDNAESLNLEQCEAALRAVARMHAASVALLDHEQYSGKLFRESLIFNTQLLEAHQDMFVDGFEKMLDVLDENTWFRKYTGKLRALAPRLVGDTLETVVDCHVDFKAMLHGDLHKNNMMFRADQDGLQVRFYDFQGLHIGSPAEDLQYFLHTSASLEVLRHHVDHLLCEYHSTLQGTLRALGLHQQADDFPLRQLMRDMNHFRMVAVYITFNILPFVLLTGNLDIPMDSTADDFEEKYDICRKKYCRNDRFLQYIEYLVPFFDAKGLLEPKTV